MTENPYIRNPHLEGDTFFFKGGKTGVLLFHGFTATTAEVRLLANCLHKAKFTISVPLLPGHGTYPAELNDRSWQDWYTAAEKAYLDLADKCQHVFVSGESMGALLALLLASRHPEISGLIVFSPAIKIKGLWQSRLLAPFKPWLVKTGADDGLPWKGYNVYPLKAAVQMLKLQKVVRKELSKIAQPTIIFTGAYDHTIDPDSGNIISEGISSQIKHVHLMPESPHCIILDKEVDKACQITKEFIGKALADLI